MAECTRAAARANAQPFVPDSSDAAAAALVVEDWDDALESPPIRPPVTPLPADVASSEAATLHTAPATDATTEQVACAPEDSATAAGIDGDFAGMVGGAVWFYACPDAAKAHRRGDGELTLGSSTLMLGLGTLRSA